VECASCSSTAHDTLRRLMQACCIGWQQRLQHHKRLWQHSLTFSTPAGEMSGPCVVSAAAPSPTFRAATLAATSSANLSYTCSQHKECTHSNTAHKRVKAWQLSLHRP
jgi:hypothetical protein